MVRQYKKAMSFLFSILLCFSHLDPAVLAEEEILPAEEGEQTVLVEETPEEEISEAEEAAAEEELPEEQEDNTVTVFPEPETGETEAEEERPDPENEEQEMIPEPAGEETPEETEVITEETEEADEGPEISGPFMADASEYVFQEGAFLKEEEEKAEAYAASDAYDPHTDFDALNAAFQSVVSGWGTRMDVSSYQIPNDDIGEVFGTLLNANPQFFYLGSRITYTPGSEYVSRITFIYDTGYTQADSAAFENRVSEIISGVSSSWSDTQKALYLHDVLVIDNTYDLSLQKHNAYNALIERTSVCQGYALAYKYLLSRAGIESDIISCDSFNHAWNSVVIDGTTYYVDATWDDPTGTYRMRCRHVNFLRDRDGLLATGHLSEDGTDAKDWVNSFGENVYDSYLTDYYGAYWLDCDTQIPHIGDSWFCADSSTGNIIRYVQSTGDFSILATLDGKWRPVGDDNSYYNSKYISLDVFEDTVIASQQDAVYVIDMSGNVTLAGELTAEERNAARIYGIRTEGYNIRYDLYPDPGTSDLYDSGHFVLKEYVPVTGIHVSPAAKTMTAGETFTLKVSVEPDLASDKTVTWTSSDTSVAAVSSAGVVTAAGSGTARITAATVNGLQAYCDITVNVPLSGIALSTDTVSLAPGSTAQLSVIYTPAGATDQAVSWQSSDTGVAAVDENGLVTAVANGSAVITVTANDGGYTDTCTVTVTTPLRGITLNKHTLTLQRTYQGGTSETLTVTFDPEDASDKYVTWSSSNTSVASVSQTGRVTARGAGTAVITAASGDGQHTDSCTVTVTVPIMGIHPDVHVLNLRTGESYAVSVMFDPEDTTDDRTLRWTSQNTAIAAVDPEGTVTAVSPGHTKIIVSAMNGRYRAEIDVYVTTPATGLVLTEHELTLNKGSAISLGAQFTPEGAETQNVIWTVSDETVAAVSQDGTVTAVNKGTAWITASTEDGSLSDSCKVTVRIPVEQIFIDGRERELTVGSAMQLSLRVLPEDAETDGLVWASEEPEYASVDQDGTVTGISPGEARISVTSLADDIYVCVTIQIIPGVIPVTGISLDKDRLTVEKGNTEVLNVLFEPEDAAQPVIWSSSDENIVSVDAGGRVTGVGAGTADITVSTEDGLLSDSCTVTVTVPMQSVQMGKKEVFLYLGDTYRQTVIFSPEDTTDDRTVTWETVDSDIVSVDQTGMITGLQTGLATVIVRTGSGLFDTCSVYVVVPMTGIVLSTHQLTLNEGAQRSLDHSFTPADARPQNVTWSSSDETVASVSESGRVTAVGKGTAVITVTTADGSFSDSCTVRVRVPVEEISIYGLETEVGTGRTIQLGVSIQPEEAEILDITWSSSDPSAAIVDQTGKVTGISAGEVIITASSALDGLSASVTIRVISSGIPVTGIVLDAHALTLNKGETAALTAQVMPQDAANKNIIWTSSDDNVVTVSEDGFLTAAGRGSAVITVTAEDGNYTDSCTVTVKVPMQAVQMGKKDVFIYLGDTYQQTVSFVPSDTTDDRTVTWTSLNSDIASVDRNGKITARSTGLTTIVATTKAGPSDSCNVYVVVPMTGIVLSAHELTLNTGAQNTLHYSFTPEDARPQNVIWSSSDETVAAVSTGGKVTAVGKGTADITVRTADGSFYDTCRVTVRIPVEEILVFGFEQEVKTGETLRLSTSVTPAEAGTESLTWTSSDPGIATVSQNGLVTGVSEGTVQIVVSSEADGISTAVEVTVISGETQITEITLNETSVTLTAPPEIFDLDVFSDSGKISDRDIIWTSSDEYMVSVDEDGVIKAVWGDGSATITAALAADGTVTASCEVTVTSPYSVLREMERALVLYPGEVHDLKARFIPEYGEADHIEWQTSDASVAAVNEAGQVSALNAGTALISAYLKHDGHTYLGRCEVTVAGSDYRPVSQISLNLVDHTAVAWTESMEWLTAYVYPDSATVKTVNWKSSDYSVADVDPEGYVWFRDPGVALVWCESADGMIREERRFVSLPEGSVFVSGFAFDAHELTVGRGRSVQLPYHFTPSDAANQNLEWTVDDERIAEVQPDGTVIGLREGTTYVHALTEAGDYTDSCRVTVTDSVPVESITLRETKVLLADYLQEYYFEISVYPEDAADPAFIYTSDNENVVTVSASGVVSAVGSGTATVRVAWAGDENVCALCEFEVAFPDIEPEISASELVLNRLWMRQLSVQCAPYQVIDHIEWVSDDDHVAEVSEDGLVTAIAGGNTTVHGYVYIGEDVYDLKCAVTVNADPYIPVSEVTLSAYQLTMLIGDMYPLSAYLRPTNASRPRYSWSSDNENVAVVDENGHVTAVGTGTAVIRATSLDGAYAECSVRAGWWITKITLDETDLELERGDTFQLTWMVEPEEASGQEVVFTNDRPDVLSVDENGLITALGLGPAIITVSPKSSEISAQAFCRVYVREKAPVIPVISDTELLMDPDDTVQLTVAPGDGEQRIVRIEWSSDDINVAAAGSDGLVTAVHGGETVIRAAVYTEAGEVFDLACLVTVTGDKYVPVSEISLPEGLYLQFGASYSLSAEVYPEDATDRNVIWSSDDETVAAVDENGNVTAVGTGVTNIIAHSADGLVFATCRVEVRWWIESVEFTEKEITLSEEDTYPLMISITPEEASDWQLFFSTDRPDVVSVDQDGLVTALAEGTAVVTVSSEEGSVSDSCVITVKKKYIPVTWVGLNVSDQYMFERVGSTCGFSAYWLPADATDPVITWSSSDESVAKIDEYGEVMAMGPGTAVITALSADGAFAECFVTVSAAEAGRHVIGDYIYYLTEYEASLVDYIRKPADVVIPAYVNDLPVTSIGKSVFEGHSEIETVVLPDTVKQIGAYAFADCTSLYAVDLGSGLTDLGPGAFKNCLSLAEISLPAGLSHENDTDWDAEEGPFAMCSGLKDVSFEQDETGSTFWMIPDGLFRDCTGLEEITLPSSVHTVGTQAFAGCTGLRYVTLPENMEMIGRSAFEGCVSLERLWKLYDLHDAGPYAFKDCCLLDEAGFTASLGTVPEGLFENCSSLRSVTLSPAQFSGWDTVYQTGPFAGCRDLAEIVFIQDESLSGYRIPEGMFRDCIGVRQVTIPSYITEIGTNAFAGCLSLNKAVIPDSVTYIGAYAFQNCQALSDVTLSRNLGVLSAGLFEYCLSLSEIVLPAGLSAGDAGDQGTGPFSGCGNLTSVTFEEGFTSIPEGLFKDCSGLREIRIPETVTKIGAYAFGNTYLEEIWMSCLTETVGDGAFRLYSGHEPGLRVHFAGTPELWQRISIGAYNEGLWNAEIDYTDPVTGIKFPPGQVTVSLGSEYDILPVIVPEIYSSVPLIWSSDNSGVVTVDENGHIIAVGQGEAVITAELGSVSGSYSVTVTDLSLYEYEVNEDGGITIVKYTGEEENVVVPATIDGLCVTRIGEGAFAFRNSVKTVSLPDTVIEIGNEAFAGCSELTGFDIPAGVQRIGESTFSGCEKMEYVTIPDSVTQIGDKAFYKCYALDHVTVPGSVTAMGEQVFFRCEALTDIRLSSSLTEIPAETFYGCTSLREIEIPEGVTTIGERAFEGCGILDHVVLPATLSAVGAGAFSEVSEEITVDYSGRRYLYEQIEFAEGNEIIRQAEVICHPAQEDRVPAQPPVIRYQDEKGVLKKAAGETAVKDGTVISLTSAGEGKLLYTLNGSDPVYNGTAYTSEIILQFEGRDRIILKTAAVPAEDSEYQNSPVAEAVFIRKQNTWQEDPGDVTRPDADKVDEVIPGGIWVTGTEQAFVYTGKARTFSALRVYDGNRLLKKNTDYKVKYSGNIHSYGDPLLTITGLGNYRDVIEIPFTISPADLNGASVSDLSVKYSTALAGPALTVTYNGLKLKEGKDFLSERPDEIDENGGTYEIVLTGINDFTGSRTILMYVSPADARTVAVSKVTVPKIASVPYAKGEKVDPEALTTTAGAPLSFRYNKKVLNADQYSLTVANDEKPGTAYLVMTGTGIPDENGTAFTGTRKISFRITGPAVKTHAGAREKTFLYDGREKALVMYDLETGEDLAEGQDYKVTWNKRPVNAGKYTATVTGITYTGSMKLTVTVTPVSEGISYVIDTAYAKGGTPAVAVRCDGLILKPGKDYTVTYGKLAGLTRKVTVKMKGNYSGTYAETVTMDPKDLSEVTMKVSDSAYSAKAGKNYAVPVLTDTNGKQLKAGTDYVKPAAGSEAYTYVKDTRVTVGTGKKAVREYRSAGEAVRKTDIIPTGTMIRVTVQAKGSCYTGSLSAVYMVISSVNRLAGAKVTVKETYEYTGKAIIPSVNDIEVILKDGTVLSADEFEIISVTGNIKPSKKAKVTVRGVNGKGYGGTASGLFTIVRQDLELADAENADANDR